MMRGVDIQLESYQSVITFCKINVQGRNNPRVFIVASVSPFRGGGLWVKVDDGGGDFLGELLRKSRRCGRQSKQNTAPIALIENEPDRDPPDAAESFETTHPGPAPENR